jgi:GT2 family glycosyltransferase
MNEDGLLISILTGHNSMSSPSPAVSVVIPVWNGGENFRICLSSLAKANPPPSEILVVADGDTDGSGEIARSAGARVFRLPVRGGPARARNFGARKTTGEILLFVDADVAVPEDAIGQVASAFRREPDLAALMGSYDDEPGDPNFVSQYKNLFHHYVHQTSKEEASTFWGACGAIRRDVFMSLGGFDENYSEPSIEDIEMGRRLKKAGFRIQLCKQLQIKHLKPWSILSLWKSDFFYRAIPWTRLILQEHRFPDDLNLKLSSRLSVVLTYALFALLLLRASGLWREGFFVAGPLAAVLLILNAPLYRFFFRKRGGWFLARSIPLHWIYFFYCGLALVIGFAGHRLHRSPHSYVARPGGNTSG